MLARTAHWCELAAFFTESKTCESQLIAEVEAKQIKMGLKFNFRRIPLHWRLLVCLQLGISGVIMAYRQRVLKAKQQQE